MSLLDFIFGKKNTSAKIARDRLQIIIAQERYQSQIPDYLPTLRRELMEVLSKYVSISPEDIRITQEKNEDMEVLELNITLSEIKGDAGKDSPDGRGGRGGGSDEEGPGGPGIGGSQKKK